VTRKSSPPAPGEGEEARVRGEIYAMARAAARRAAAEPTDNTNDAVRLHPGQGTRGTDETEETQQ
jgi:hypothetical protein